MAERRWSLHDAKNKFSAVVNGALAGRPQYVTRRGKPAVVVLSVEAYERLKSNDEAQAPSFVEHLLNIPQKEEEFERLDLRLRDVDF